MDEETVLTEEDLYRLHRHFINLMCVDSGAAARKRAGGGPLVYNFSAFLVEVADVWLAVTAGHIFEDMRKAVTGGSILTDWQIDDTMVDGPWVRPYPIAFDINRDVMFFNVDGLDYACFVIGELTVCALTKNGICPIPAELWNADDLDAFNFWSLIGSPLQLSELHPNGHSIKLHVTIPLSRVLERPSGIDETANQRLYAKLHFEAVKGMEGGFDIGGMSGGPVFGTLSTPQGGKYEYRLIGIQSAWNMRDSVAICAAQPFLRAMLDLVRQRRIKIRAEGEIPCV